MRREIKVDKQVKINGQIVSLKKVLRCRYDNEKDNPFSTTQNERRWNTFLSVKNAWETLDANALLSELADDFEYGSYWVDDPMRGVDAYTEYIKEKFATIAKNNSQPIIFIVILREGIAPIDYTYALLLRQGETECLLLFDFLGDKISRLYMTDPDIHAFDLYRIGVLDANGEPRMFKHNSISGRAGEDMTYEELLSFTTQVTATLLNEQGLIIVSVYPKPVKEFPNVVYDETGTRCFLRLLPFLPPAMKAEDDKRENFSKFIDMAHKQNAVAIIQPVGLFCMDTMGKSALNGGTFAVRFTDQIVG